MINHFQIVLKKMPKVMCFVFILMSANAFGQRINVTSASELVEKIQRTGLKVSLPFDTKTVASAWENYLEKYGSVDDSKKVFLMEKAKIPSISDKPIRIVSKVEEEGKNQSYVFCAFDAGSSYIMSGDSRYGVAEKFLRDFALKVHKDVNGDLVADAEKDLLNAQKDQQKLIQKDEDLNKSIQNANEDITSLQKKIEDKKKSIIDYTKQLEDNKSAKQKAAEEVERTRKVADQMKQKLGEIR